ncbi:hypothetical protein ABPG72_007885 [Tetrahymena utriculariae]
MSLFEKEIKIANLNKSPKNQDTSKYFRSFQLYLKLNIQARYIPSISQQKVNVAIPIKQGTTLKKLFKLIDDKRHNQIQLDIILFILQSQLLKENELQNQLRNKLKEYNNKPIFQIISKKEQTFFNSKNNPKSDKISEVNRFPIIIQEQQNNHNNIDYISNQCIKKLQVSDLYITANMGQYFFHNNIHLSTLYRINRNSFIKLIQENQEDFERFKMMEEQIKFFLDYSILYLECYACKGMGHFVRDCPIVHQKFDSQFIALKDNFSLFQKKIGKGKKKILKQ